MTEKAKYALRQVKAQCKCLPSETAESCVCFVNQLHHAIEGHQIRQKTLSVIAPFMAVMLFMCYLFVTAPYGLTEDGKKVDTPYVIKAGSVELAVVENQAAAELAMNQFKESMMSKSGSLLSFESEPMLLVVPKDLERGTGPVEIVTPSQASASMQSACAGDFPFFSVSMTEEVTVTKSIAYKTKVKESDDYVIGYKEVLTKGKNGKKEIVYKISRVNGEVVGKKIISETVVKKPVKKVVLEGTASAPTQVTYRAASISTSGQAKSGTTGADVVNYAMQFLGNPYVYGGTSLTHGTDCSGFTMSVYAHFGVYLPHASSAQRSYGKTVSYSEIQKGDLIFYTGHVAIYMGGGKIIHASTPYSDICIDSARYDTILCIKRIL